MFFSLYTLVINVVNFAFQETEYKNKYFNNALKYNYKYKYILILCKSAKYLNYNKIEKCTYM